MVSGRLPAPPFSLGRRETRLHSSENPSKTPQFRDSRLETGLEKVSRGFRRPGFAAIFSGPHTGNPVSANPLGFWIFSEGQIGENLIHQRPDAELSFRFAGKPDLHKLPAKPPFDAEIAVSHAVVER